MKEILKRIYAYFRPHRGKIFTALIASVVVSSTDGATAYIVKHILDDIFIAKNQSMLKLIPLIIIVIYAI